MLPHQLQTPSLDQTDTRGTFPLRSLSPRECDREIGEREYPSIAAVVVEVAKPMLYGFMAVLPFLLHQNYELPSALFAVTGVLYGVFLIWGIVRWINRRPSIPPDAP
jgi:hypothetical protein